jgi:hypothetical protein
VTRGGKVYKVSGIEAICEAMRNEAIKGDVGAATWCRDTAYGRPVQALEIQEDGVIRNLVLVVNANGELAEQQAEQRIELTALDPAALPAPGGNGHKPVDVTGGGNGHDGP